MKELLAIYTFLPIVYFIYRAGELASEKGYNPVRWRIRTYLITITTASIVALIAGTASSVAHALSKSSTDATTLTLITSFIVAGLSTGFFLLSRLNKRPVISHPKRTYRTYDLKNAVLFPRVIPRGGFLWRVIVYNILFRLILWLMILPLRLTKTALAGLPAGLLIPAAYLIVVVFLGVICFAMLYYISNICVPRIRDAGLSRDTLIMLFIPGLSLIALILLFATPTRISGRSSV